MIEEKKERLYTFTRKVICIEYGVVTAKSKEQALKLVQNGEYDDIINSSWEETIDNSIEIKED